MLDIVIAKYQLGTSNNKTYSWFNTLGISFRDDYKNDFNYRFEHQCGSNFKNEHEPYYAFLWSMKEIGCKFDYLYPHFDERFKSTNPRLEKDSPYFCEIAISTSQFCEIAMFMKLPSGLKN